MKKITGLDASLNYVPTLRSSNFTNLTSDGNGLFSEKIAPKEFVNKLIEIIKNEGDVGLRKVVESIDGKCPDSFLVSADECKLQLESLKPKIKKSLETSIQRVTDFQIKTLPKSWKNATGEFGEKVTPIESIAAYVPGGTAPLLSTAVMTITPALVAGVKRIVVITPSKNPTLIGCATLAGADEIYTLGGAQAIAAMAYGTESIEPVDFICGPGNVWVTEAKKAVYGDVGIDGIYGPTETMLIVDDHSNFKIAAADLLAQSEHDTMAVPILVSIGSKAAEGIITLLYDQLKTLPRKKISKQSLEERGVCFVVSNPDEAISIANTVAPEHLCITTDNEKYIADRCVRAGGLFVGENSGEVIADYIAGPSHVMPTAGTAKFNSALSSKDFVTITPYLNLTRKTFVTLAESAAVIADEERLDGHAVSLRLRLKELIGE